MPGATATLGAASTGAQATSAGSGATATSAAPVPSVLPPTKGQKLPRALRTGGPKKKLPAKQVMGSCSKCGYLSSQAVCKACVLLEGLNKSRPKNAIEVSYDVQDFSMNSVRDELEATTLSQPAASTEG